MDQDEFTEKYDSLSSSDRGKVSIAIYHMEDECLDGPNEYDEEDSYGERLSVYDAAEIWASSGMDEDYTFGYSVEELKNAL